MKGGYRGVHKGGLDGIGKGLLMKDILDVMIWLTAIVGGLLVGFGSGTFALLASLLGLAKITKKDALSIGSWLLVISAIIGLITKLLFG